MPQALLQYQDSDEILQAKGRKELVEELATALAAHQINLMKAVGNRACPCIRGVCLPMAPPIQPNMYRLINSYTVLEMARAIAAKRHKSAGAALDQAVRNLILTEDFALMSALAKHASTAIADYSETELAALIANKRIEDFKRTLSLAQYPFYAFAQVPTAGFCSRAKKIRKRWVKSPALMNCFARQAIPEVLAKAS